MTSTKRVAQRYLIQKKASSDILMTLLGGSQAYYNADQSIGDKDTQASNLFTSCIQKLADALELPPNHQQALNRIQQIVANANHWDAGLIRNNVFKVANLLGLKLPSFMFASEGASKQAAGVTKSDIKMKNGDVVPRGTRIQQVKFMSEHEPNATKLLQLLLDYTGPSGRDYTREPMKLGISKAWEIVPGISKPPSISALQRMSDNSIATTPTGKRTEPDGYGSDGSPSWLLVLGYI